jgi:hypothetical protein
MMLGTDLWQRLWDPSLLDAAVAALCLELGEDGQLIGGARCPHSPSLVHTNTTSPSHASTPAAATSIQSPCSLSGTSAAAAAALREERVSVSAQVEERQKKEEKKESLEEGWKILNDSKKCADLAAMSQLLDDLGLYEAGDLEPLSSDVMDELLALLKKGPKAKVLQLCKVWGCGG